MVGNIMHSERKSSIRKKLEYDDSPSPDDFFQPYEPKTKSKSSASSSFTKTGSKSNSAYTPSFTMTPTPSSQHDSNEYLSRGFVYNITSDPMYEFCIDNPVDPDCWRENIHALLDKFAKELFQQAGIQVPQNSPIKKNQRLRINVEPRLNEYAFFTNTFEGQETNKANQALARMDESHNRNYKSMNASTKMFNEMWITKGSANLEKLLNLVNFQLYDQSNTGFTINLISYKDNNGIPLTNDMLLAHLQNNILFILDHTKLKNQINVERAKLKNQLNAERAKLNPVFNYINALKKIDQDLKMIKRQLFQSIAELHHRLEVTMSNGLNDMLKMELNTELHSRLIQKLIPEMIDEMIAIELNEDTIDSFFYSLINKLINRLNDKLMDQINSLGDTARLMFIYLIVEYPTANKLDIFYKLLAEKNKERGDVYVVFQQMTNTLFFSKPTKATINYRNNNNNNNNCMEVENSHRFEF
jgi:hypothetical protein